MSQRTRVSRKEREKEKLEFKQKKNEKKSDHEEHVDKRIIITRQS